MSDSLPDHHGYSFDEYKLYYESTEKVTDRRLATNTWNYGLCSAILLAVAGLASWGMQQPVFRLVMIGAILMLASMGWLLCSLWIDQIRDFKELNSAKFEVLNSMAPLIRFGADGALISARPFENEWKILEAKKATREVGTLNIIALRSSNAEFLVPRSFRWLYSLIVVVGVIAILVNWRVLAGGQLDFTKAIGQNPTTIVTPVTPQVGR
jgi:hypothetical protein